MSFESVKNNGEYLGYCPVKKGYIYSLFRGYDKEGNKQYAIVCIHNGDVHILIQFTSYS